MSRPDEEWPEEATSYVEFFGEDGEVIRSGYILHITSEDSIPTWDPLVDLRPGRVTVTFIDGVEYRYDMPTPWRLYLKVYQRETASEGVERVAKLLVESWTPGGVAPIHKATQMARVRAVAPTLAAELDQLVKAMAR